jgi:hypothetical protein
MSPRLGGRTGSRRPKAARDQVESDFARILSALVRRIPGARAAALVDVQGETVDYTGRAEPFDLRVSAAEFRLVLRKLQAQPSLTPPRWLLVSATRGSYLAYALPDGYALVVLFARRAGFSGWRRAVAMCAAELAVEAHWIPGARIHVAWGPVSVDADSATRPRAVRAAGVTYPIDIIGQIVVRTHAVLPASDDAFVARERGWRVRVVTPRGGMEMTLVREPGGKWYADEDLDEAVTPWRSKSDG